MSLLELHHRQAIVEMEWVPRRGIPRGERFLEMVGAFHGSFDLAAREAVEQAELRGRPAMPRKIIMAQSIEGFCRDCGETVFAGGEARPRFEGDIRCWGCGGGP